jgi:hypothetical protein
MFEAFTPFERLLVFLVFVIAVLEFFQVLLKISIIKWLRSILEHVGKKHH